MAQYDGSIRINTQINTDGMHRGASVMSRAASGIGRSATGMQRSFDRMGASIKKLGSIMVAVFSIRAITQFGKAALDAASDLEAMESQFSQVFGDMEAAASESLSRIAGQAGVAEDRMKASFTKIAAFAKTTGMNTADSLALSERAMVAIADSAAFYDRSLEETTETLQSFLKGNYENDAALGLSATEYTRNAAAMKLYGKSFIDLTEAQKQLTLLQMVEDANALSGAMGQAAREADTWTNQIGNLKQAWTSLLANLGKIVLPVAIQAVKFISNVINSINAMIQRLTVAAGAFRSFSELLTGKKSTAGNDVGADEGAVSGMGADYEDAAAGAEDLASATDKATKSTKEAEKAAEGYLSPLDEINKIGKEDIEVPEVEDTKGEGAGGPSAIPAVDYGNLEEGETVIDKIADKLSRIFDVFKQAWDNKGKAVIDSAKAALKSLKDAASAVAETFYDVFTGGVGLAWVESCLDLLRSMLDIVTSIATAFTEAWNSGAGEENVTALFTMLTNVNNLLTAIGDSFVRAFNDGIGVQIWTNILGIITGVYNIIGNLAASLTEAWNTAGLGDSIWAGILSIINTILETVHGIVDSTADWAAKLDFTPLLRSIDGLLKAIQPLAENIGAGLKWFWDNVLLPIAGWTVEEAVPAFLDILSRAIDVVNAALEALQPAGQWFWDNFLQPLGEWAGDAFISAMRVIAALLDDFAKWVSENPAKFKAMTITALAFFAAFKAPAAISSVQSFIGIIGKLRVAMGTLTSGGFTAGASIVAKLGNAFTLAAGGAGSLHQVFTIMFGSIGTALAGIGSIILGAVTAITNFFAMLKEGFSWVNEILMVIGVALAAIGAVILGAPALVAAAVAGVVAALATIVVIVKEHWESICEFFSNAAQWFGDNVVTPIADFFKGLWEDVAGFFSGLWKDIQAIWTSVSGWFNEKVITPVVDLFQGFYTRIKQIFEGLWIIIQAVWILVSGWFNDKVVTPVVNLFKGLWEKVSSFFSKLWSGIKEMWSKAAGWFNSTVITPLTDFFKSVWTKVSGYFSSLWSGIKEVWQGVSDWFSRTVIDPVKNAWKSATDAIAGFFSGLWNGIANGVVGAMNAVIGGIESGINFIVRGINYMLEGFNSIVSWAADIVGVSWGGVSLVPEVSLSRIPIPHLAQGTVVPPNREFMAVLGDNKREPEVVSPVSTLEEASKRGFMSALTELGLTGGGNSGTIIIKQYLDKKQVAEAIIQEGKLKQMSTGRNMFLLE